TDSGISSEKLIKEEPIDDAPAYPQMKREDKSVAKLIDRVRLAEKDREATQAQLHFVIDKYTAEMTKNRVVEKKATDAMEENERLRRELKDAQKQLENSRESKDGHDRNSKMVLKSNMELACQVANLRQTKAGLEEDIRTMTKCAQSFEQKLVEERAKTAESEARANHYAKEFSAYRQKMEEEVFLLKKVIETVDREKIEAQAEVAESRMTQAKLKTDHDELRKINGFLATTASGQIYEQLSKAHKHIETLEKRVRPFDPRLESAQPKKRKTG
ncbi:hypothetical protein PMAYCL1PPCAC_08697, partial [Pristionchus mayeri]